MFTRNGGGRTEAKPGGWRVPRVEVRTAVSKNFGISQAGGRMLSQVSRAEAEASPFQGEYRTILPTGVQRWVLVKGSIESVPGSPYSLKASLDLSVQIGHYGSAVPSLLHMRQKLIADTRRVTCVTSPWFHAAAACRLLLAGGMIPLARAPAD